MMRLNKNPTLGAEPLLLKGATAFYLALPTLLFAGGWLRWEISFPLILLALFGLWRSFFGAANLGHWREIVPSAGTIVLVLVLSWIAGTAGTFCQRADWWKHNCILFDLVNKPWPVWYDGPSGALPLVYYIAYYLPAACVGKVFGLGGAQAALFVWTVIGLCLVVLWLKVLAHTRKALWVAVVFFLFSGWDVIGSLCYGVFDRLILHDGSHPWYQGEGWSAPLQYSSFINWLFWVPQHALSAWLFTALIMGGKTDGKSGLCPSIWLCVGYSVLWSPFVSLGLAPLLATRFFGPERKWILRQFFSVHVLACFLFAGVGLLYFLAKIGPTAYAMPSIPGGLIFALPGADGNMQLPSGSVVSDLWISARVLLFYFLEVGVFALPIWWWWRGDSDGKKLFLASLVWLFLLPWFFYGLMNDLVMRASGPALFVLAVLGLGQLFGPAPRHRFFWIFSAVWFIGSLSAFLTLSKQVQMGVKAWPGSSALQNTRSIERGILHLESGGYFNTPYSAQYIGRSDSAFFRFLAPPENGDKTHLGVTR